MGAHDRLSVLVLESHRATAEALVVALAAFGIAGEAIRPSGTDLSGLAELAVSFDVVLVGLLAAGVGSTLALVGALAATGRPVLVCTADRDTVLAGDALRAGAVAVVRDDMRFEHLVAALRSAGAGRPLLTADERSALLEHLPAVPSPFDLLTPAEARTLTSLVEGCSPKAVATADYVSIHAVRKRIRAILAKLDVATQREALALARRARWPPDGV